MNRRDNLKHMERMENALRYMDENIHKKLTLKEVAMAEGVNYNPAYFGDIFLEYFEMPWRTYYLKMKMRAAARLILIKHDIRNVFKQFGYNDIKNFNKVFVDEIGVKPAEFLANGLPVPDMPARKQVCGIPISSSVIHEMIPGIDILPPFAVFSAEWTGDDWEDCETLRILQKYALDEWAFVNRKAVNRMAKVQIRYDGSRLWLYLSLLGMQKELENWKISLQGALYREYIDSHITEEIRTEDFADKVHYSGRGLKAAFEKLYGITADKYIESTRLSLAIEELQDEARRNDETARKYQFQSMGHFGRLFYNRYGVYYKDYEKPQEETAEIQTENITAPFDSAWQIRLSLVDLPDMRIAAYPVNCIPSGMKMEDIPAMVTHWFTQAMKCASDGDHPGIRDNTDKIFLYDIHMYEQINEWNRSWPLGIILSEGEESGFVKEDNPPAITGEYTEKLIRGGRYVQFEMEEDHGQEKLMEAYRQMEAGVFFKWYYNNRTLINKDKEMFIKYKEGKLYACLPLRTL